MSTSNPKEPPAGGSRAFLLWFAATGIFLAFLLWLVLPAAPKEESKAAQAVQPGGDAVKAFVLDGLAEKEAPAIPSQAFGKDSGYVLVGAGLQGFYQTSAPDTVWTFSYPEPRLEVQLIKRGPPTPQIITEGMNVTWKLAAGQPSKSGQSGKMEAVKDSHFRASVPVNAGDAAGTVDPYPVVTLRAEDAKTGELLVETSAVLAVSPGFGCASCHENAGIAILEVHDRHAATDLKQRNAKGEVIACRSCHDTAELTLSAAMHGWHAAYLPGKDETACMTCHVSLGRTGKDTKADPSPLFARDFHTDYGITCVSCHGYMEDHALALLKTEKENGKPQAQKVINALAPRAVPLDAVKGRQAWLQEPDCASCHDFSKRPDPQTASAFNKWSEKEGGEAGLFSRRSDDMLMVRCISCHGAPHAVYTATNPVADGLDNLQPAQYQKTAGPMGAYGNCATCHGESKDFFVHHPVPSGN